MEQVYEVKVIDQDDYLLYQGTEVGRNALEAFEKVHSYSCLPPQATFTVLVVSDRGLGFKFEVFTP